MDCIKIEVTGNIARVTDRPSRITSGTVGLPIEFTFDEQWEGLSKTAVFRGSGITKIVDSLDSAAIVPWEVLAKPNTYLHVGVYGVNGDGTVVIPTIWTNVQAICKGVNPEGDVAAKPTLPVWQKLLNFVGDLIGLQTQNKNNLVEAINEVHNIAIAGGIVTDTTLTKEGSAAEAKATGTAIKEVREAAETHKNNKLNPHNVTASQVGLGNVDNTSDADKPVSTEQAMAIADAKNVGKSAQTTANEALHDAKYAQDTANDALDAAGTAKSHADNARIEAAQAKSLANYAQTSADNAQTSANNAQTAANNAQTSANNAQVTAENAQAAADNAQATADNALNLAAIEDDAHKIPENSDLNDYTTPGAYCCTTSAIAATLANGPSYTGAGFRLVVSATSTVGGIVQFAIFNTTGNPRIFWRIRNNNGTWSDWIRAIGHDVGTNLELWTGSWESGSITVPDTSAYRMFLIGMDGVGTVIPAFRYDEYIRGVGGYSTSAPAVSTYQFAASYNGNKWTLAACNSISHTNNGNHGSVASRTVIRVIGYL